MSPELRVGSPSSRVGSPGGVRPPASSQQPYESNGAAPVQPASRFVDQDFPSTRSNRGPYAMVRPFGSSLAPCYCSSLIYQTALTICKKSSLFENSH